MAWLLIVIASVAVLFIADRLLLAAEARGWVYYRRRKSVSGSVTAAAFGPVFDILQPSRQVIVEEREHERLLRHDAGNEDDDEPRATSPDP